MMIVPYRHIKDIEMLTEEEDRELMV